MNVKVRILLGILILTVLGALFIGGNLLNEVHHDPEYTAQSSAVYTDDFGVFFMENWNDMGRLYRIGENGSVLHMTDSGNFKLDKAEKLAYHDRKLYALYSSERKDSEGTYPVYRIVSYDESLDPVRISDYFTIDKTLSVCSLTADGLDVYISTISPNGEAVTVFDVPVTSLHDMTAEENNTSEPENNGSDEPVTRKNYVNPDAILHRERSKKRFFVDAAFINQELHVLLDGDTPEGVFAPDARIKKAVDSIDFTVGQKLRLHSGLIIKVVGMFLIWLILVILTLKLTKDRNRIVYLFSASEVVFFVILFLAFFFIKDQFLKNETKNNTRFAMMVMQEDLKYYSGVDYDEEGFVESTKYYRLMDSLADVLNENNGSDVFHDAFVMRKSSGMVLADAKGRTGVHASYLYGGEMSSLLQQLTDNKETVSASFSLEGEELTAVAYESENPNDDLALVAICKSRKYSESYKKSSMWLGILFIIIFVIGSILLFLALYLQHMDLKKFNSALKDLALEDKKAEIPKSLSRDMRELWQCYGELCKKIELINYEKYRIFEAYYRFAPKGIENIMGRESIFDVENGDIANVSGTIVLLSVDKEISFETKVKSLSGMLTNMEKYAKKNEAILISRDQSLSNVRFLIMKDKSDMVSQIVQFIHGTGPMASTGWSILMYRDVLTYGVAGSQMQSLTYIDSEYSRKMDAYAEWFRMLGIPLVVTERILRTDDVGEKRYIGCAAFDGGEDIVHFYEILDAYPAEVRQMMLINRTRFEETLELFYSKDFYLARNQFMDILKDCPRDGITRWYIFECERYMNGQSDIKESAYIQVNHQD